MQSLYTNSSATNPAPSFLLIVGDVAQVPAFSGTTETHKTDLYYCEYTGDFLPELYYGRFSATTAAEVTTQVSKTLEYEQYLFPDPSFLNNMMLVAGVDAGMAPTYGNGQVNYATDNYVNIGHGINPYVFLYPQSANTTASGNIISNINSGCSIYNYSAHGYEQGFADPSFSNSDVATLTNAHKYPLIIGNCCLTNSFDQPVCFGESLLRANNKGAIGYIGGSNVTYWDEDYWWATGAHAISANPTYSAAGLGMYDCLYHEKGEPDSTWFVTNGQMIYAGNMAVIDGGGNDHYYWEIYHLMGDPSLMTYLGVPANLSVIHNPTDLTGTSSLTVQTETNAYVAISLNGVLLDAQLAGASGTVTLNFPAINTAAVAEVVVTKQNRKSYIGSYSISTTTGIYEFESENSIAVVNPVEDDILKVSIRSTMNKVSELQLYGIDGRLIRSEKFSLKKGSNEFQINVSELSKGLYTIRLSGNEKPVKSKLILINR